MDRLKKKYKLKRIVVGCGFTGVGAYVGAAIGTAIVPLGGTVVGGAIGAAIGGLFGPDTVEGVEEIINWDDPLNPLG